MPFPPLLFWNLFLPLLCSQAYEAFLGCRAGVFQPPLFHGPSSAHRLVVVVADVGEGAAVWGSEVRWDSPSCSNTVFGPGSRADLVHDFQASEPPCCLGGRGVCIVAPGGVWYHGVLPFVFREDNGVAPPSSFFLHITVFSDEVCFWVHVSPCLGLRPLMRFLAPHVHVG